MRFEFMEKMRNQFPIKKMAKILSISRGGYYAYAKRPPSARGEENKKLLMEIGKAYEENRGLYGSPRIHAALKRKGMVCSRKRVARLMKLNSIKAVTKKRRSGRKHLERVVAPNILEQDFFAGAPNEKWVSDISYIKTEEGWLYLAVILDLFSRKVVSFSIDTHMRAELVESALQKALLRRSPLGDLVCHSDRGSQYTGGSFKELCERSGVRQSMNSGSCYDNAAVESFFHSLKTELVYLRRFNTKEEARRAIFEYIESFYNRKRLHSTLGYMAPEEFEEQYWRNISEKKFCV
jgi:transposase InsO family protein